MQCFVHLPIYALTRIKIHKRDDWSLTWDNESRIYDDRLVQEMLIINWFKAFKLDIVLIILGEIILGSLIIVVNLPIPTYPDDVQTAGCMQGR